jgi:hypothetical protein
MKRLIAMILVGLLVAPPASAGEKPGKPITWKNVQQLKPGTEIVLTVTGGQPTTVRLLFADDTVLMTRKTLPTLPGRVEKFLIGVGPAWPGIVRAGASYTAESLRVTRDGIFDGDQKLADLADVLQQTPPEEVVGISEGPRGHPKRNFAIFLLILTGVAIILGFAACGSNGCNSV